MTGFLLDTNIVSVLRTRSRADVGLLSWLAEDQAEEFWLSVLVVGTRNVADVGSTPAQVINPFAA